MRNVSRIDKSIVCAATGPANMTSKQFYNFSVCCGKSNSIDWFEVANYSIFASYFALRQCHGQKICILFASFSTWWKCNDRRISICEAIHYWIQTISFSATGIRKFNRFRQTMTRWKVFIFFLSYAVWCNEFDPKSVRYNPNNNNNYSAFIQ